MAGRAGHFEEVDNLPLEERVEDWQREFNVPVVPGTLVQVETASATLTTSISIASRTHEWVVKPSFSGVTEFIERFSVDDFNYTDFLDVFGRVKTETDRFGVVVVSFELGSS